ncbi:MAG TPA: hypothetical protein VLH75_05070 [Longimicrobiales bacterium]|nr:hypothetical protein [Longimicrobiales bacterium]
MPFRLHPRHAVLLCLLVLGITGCASTGGTGAGGQPGGHRASNRIDAAELAPLAELDVHQVISRVRPGWLRGGPQGQLPVIVLDGSPQTSGPEMLGTFRAADVTALEYMSASDATTRFGTGYSGGAILVTTKH